VIDYQITNWLNCLQKDWISDLDNLRAFDIGKRIKFLTVDIITKICFGNELGCVSSDSDKYGLLASVEKANAFVQRLFVLHELNTFLYYFGKIPFIGPLLLAKLTDKSGPGRIMGVSDLIIS
jgi:hypothetical protein